MLPSLYVTKAYSMVSSLYLTKAAFDVAVFV